MSEFDASVAFGTTRSQPTIENSWVLYYSPEGYPYYYNHVTGESQWAESSGQDDQFETVVNPSANNTANAGGKKQHEEAESDSEEDSEESSNDNSDSDSDSSGSSDDSADLENLKKRVVEPVDQEVEQRFKAYLRTPEGMAAMEVSFKQTFSATQ